MEPKRNRSIAISQNEWVLSRPRLPPTPHPFENIGGLVPGGSHAGQDHEPWAPGNLIGLNLAGLAHEPSGKGDGPRSLELRDIPLDELVQDKQGSEVRGLKLLVLSFFPPRAAPQSLLHRSLPSPRVKAHCAAGVCARGRPASSSPFSLKSFQDEDQLA